MRVTDNQYDNLHDVIPDYPAALSRNVIIVLKHLGIYGVHPDDWDKYCWAVRTQQRDLESQYFRKSRCALFTLHYSKSMRDTNRTSESFGVVERHLHHACGGPSRRTSTQKKAHNPRRSTDGVHRPRFAIVAWFNRICRRSEIFSILGFPRNCLDM